jgi:hypothetical protein
MRALLFVTLVACTPSLAPPAKPKPAHVVADAVRPEPIDVEEEPPRFDTPRPAEAYLAGDKPTRFARMAFYESLYAAEPGEGVVPLARVERVEAPAWRVLGVVEERPRSLRVIVEDEDLRIVVYLEDRDVHRVVRKRAPARLGSNRGQGVWVRPGLVASDRGKSRTVDIDDPIFHGAASIDHRAVDRVFEPEEDEKEPNDALLAPGTVIEDEHGEALVRVPEGDALQVRHLDAAGARTRVRYVSESLWIEGFVSAVDPNEGLGAIGTIGHGAGWGSSGAKRYLHAGDRLHAGPNGPLIGLVLGERVMTLEDQDLEGGHQVSAFVSGWSFVPVWLTAEDIAFGEAWEQVYRQRFRIEMVPSTAKIAWQLEARRDAAARCWRDALARGASASLSLRVVWSGGTHIAMPPKPALAPELRACLEGALDQKNLPPPALPLTFLLHLDPTPLPVR